MLDICSLTTPRRRNGQRFTGRILVGPVLDLNVDEKLHLLDVAKAVLLGSPSVC